jgi:ribonuclease HI
MVNVDAAVFAKSSRLGFGLVMRDHNGNFLAGYKQGLDGITEPEVAEVIASRHAVHFILALPYKHVVVASDSVSAVKKLYLKEKDCCQVAVLIQDIRQPKALLLFPSYMLVDVVMR